MPSEAVSSKPGSARAIAHRVRTRVLRHRIWRFGRSVALFLLMSAAVFVLVLHTRDTQNLTRHRHASEEIVSRLQSEFNHSNRLLIRMPVESQREFERYRGFVFNPGYEYQLDSPDARALGYIGVCASSELHFYLRRNARMVVLFDGRQFSARLMSNEEYRELSGVLGL